jgi:hypothetical protein
LQDWLQGSAAYRWLIEPRRRVSHDDIELYLQITLAAVNLAKIKYGLPVILLYFKVDGEDSYLQEAGFTTDVVLRRLRDGGAIVVDTALNNVAAAGTSLSIVGDGHPTALANRMLGIGRPSRAWVRAASTSVWIERILIVLREIRVLLILVQNAIPDREELDLGAHKTGKRVLRRADDRLAAHVETGVHKNRATG